MEKPDFKLRIVKKPAPHERAYWADLIAKEIRRPIGQVLGMTKDWPMHWLEQVWAEMKQAQSPQKYFWWFRKEVINSLSIDENIQK